MMVGSLWSFCIGCLSISFDFLVSLARLLFPPFLAVLFVCLSFCLSSFLCVFSFFLCVFCFLLTVLFFYTVFASPPFLLLLCLLARAFDFRFSCAFFAFICFDFYLITIIFVVSSVCIFLVLGFLSISFGCLVFLARLLFSPFLLLFCLFA